MATIVVHPGSAHKDDFLAVSVLLSLLDSAVVYRREATAADLADPGTYVIDVGMSYDPELHNFDHHQDPTLPCAFHLVMRHLGHHDDAMQMFGWYAHMSMMDVRGPYQTAEHLGVDSSVLFASSSPIDGYILSRFSQMDCLQPLDLLYRFMKNLGQDLIALMAEKKQRLARLKAESRIVSVGPLRALVSSIAENPKLAMELYLRDLDDERIAISITPSVRGEGWEMLRLGDNIQVDFRGLEGHPDIHFIHANGFVAKTKTLIPVDAVVALASQAITAI